MDFIPGSSETLNPFTLMHSQRHSISSIKSQNSNGVCFLSLIESLEDGNTTTVSEAPQQQRHLLLFEETNLSILTFLHEIPSSFLLDDLLLPQLSLLGLVLYGFVSGDLNKFLFAFFNSKNYLPESNLFLSLIFEDLFGKTWTFIKLT